MAAPYCEARSSLRRAGRCRRHINATLWVAFARAKRGIVRIKGRAIGADELGIVPHIEIDMRMIVRRARAHALEFLDADPDPAGALVVDEMRHQRLRHDCRSLGLAFRQVAGSIVSQTAKR